MVRDGSQFDDANRQLRSEEPLTYTDLEELLRGLLRTPTMLKDALSIGIEATHFTSGPETKLAYLFAAMGNLTREHGTFTQATLVNELRSWHANRRMSISASECDEVCTFIETSMTAPPVADVHRARAERTYQESILKRFVNARMVKHGVQSVVNMGADIVPTDFESQLSRWAKKVQAVKFIGRAVENAAYAPEFGTEIALPPPPIPTTLPWIDQYLGGIRTGDIIGILGPFSGGKTTIMASAATRMAQQFHARQSGQLSVYICYEDGKDKMSHLFWSAAAQIDRRMFTHSQAQFWPQFSTAENLKAYDRELPENRNGEIMLGERERWHNMREWLNQHLVFMDFSGLASGRGSGGVPEIVAVLERLEADTGMKVGAVFIDYLGLMVERFLAADPRARAMEQITRPLKLAPDELRNTVAIPFNCTVFLAHQLAGGEIKKIPPYRYVSHLNAMGSTAFAENLHSCMCMNTRDQATGVSTINWSKIRAAAPVLTTGLIRMDDHVVGMHLVNDEYTVSEAGRRIMRRADIAPVAPGDVMPQRRSRIITPIDRFASDMGMNS